MQGVVWTYNYIFYLRHYFFAFKLQFSLVYILIFARIKHVCFIFSIVLQDNVTGQNINMSTLEYACLIFQQICGV